jgi:hypothetical protein
VTYLGVCVTYRRVLDWWPDLLHTHTTCFCTSQTAIWHTISSPSSSTAISRDFLSYLICQRSSLYTLGGGGGHRENTVSQQFLHCYRGVFTLPLHRNGSSYIAACVLISAGTCLPSRCPAVNVYSGSAVPVSRRHVTVFKSIWTMCYHLKD